MSEEPNYFEDHNFVVALIIGIAAGIAPYAVGLAIIHVLVEWYKASPPHGGYLLTALFTAVCSGYLQMRYDIKWYQSRFK
jgi:hypothetical protein